jgi:hypothetical protein
MFISILKLFIKFNISFSSPSRSLAHSRPANVVSVSHFRWIYSWSSSLSGVSLVERGGRKERDPACYVHVTKNISNFRLRENRPSTGRELKENANLLSIVRNARDAMISFQRNAKKRSRKEALRRRNMKDFAGSHAERKLHNQPSVGALIAALRSRLESRCDDCSLNYRTHHSVV